MYSRLKENKGSRGALIKVRQQRGAAEGGGIIPSPVCRVISGGHAPFL